MGSLLRSEPMTLIQIIEQNGAARDVINTLGDLGTVQFRDLNQNMQAYKRSFADEVKRCDEMSRRLGFILQQVLSAGLAPQERLVTAALVPLADLDGNLKQTHEELQELKRSEVEVLRSLNAFKEHTHVLKMGGAFSRRGGGSSQPPTPRDEPSTSMSFLEEGMPLGPLSLKAPLKGGMGGGGTGGGGKGGGDDAMLNCVTGTIPRARAGAFVRAVHRVTRGNCMATDAPIDELLLDDDKRDPQPTAKNFFMVFTQGHVLLAKLTKLCVHFGATVRCAALRCAPNTSLSCPPGTPLCSHHPVPTASAHVVPHLTSHAAAGVRRARPAVEPTRGGGAAGAADGRARGGVQGVEAAAAAHARVHGAAVAQHGRSGRLGQRPSGHHGLIGLRRKAWGCPPHS